MYYKETRKIFAQLAGKYGMKIDDISNICRAPFEFTANIISKEASNEKPDEMPNIRITNFGVFYVTEGKKNYLRKRLADGKGDTEI